MVLCYQSLQKIIEGAKPMIHSAHSLEKHIQPASIDVPVSDRCFRVSVSALPSHGRLMTSLLKRFKMYEFEIKKEGALLEKGMTYIIPLDMNLSLSEQFQAKFSPKSTIGRNDLFVRTITENGEEFDVTEFGYNGPLYLEVTPLSFHSTLYPFVPLNQMRIIDNKSISLSDEELAILHSKFGIVRDREGRPIEALIKNNSLYLHLDLSDKAQTAGYESLKNPEQSIHIGRKEVDDKDEFFRRIKSTPHGDVICHPDSFYLLYTKERIVIPPCVCATLEEYSVNMGEFRSHYAGFFDNGFGGEIGTCGVLEFRPRDLPVTLYDDQLICRMTFYRTDEIPNKLYQVGANSYTGCGPRLAKNFIGFENW